MSTENIVEIVENDEMMNRTTELISWLESQESAEKVVISAERVETARYIASCMYHSLDGVQANELTGMQPHGLEQARFWLQHEWRNMDAKIELGMPVNRMRLVNAAEGVLNALQAAENGLCHGLPEEEYIGQLAEEGDVF